MHLRQLNTDIYECLDTGQKVAILARDSDFVTILMGNGGTRKIHPNELIINRVSAGTKKSADLE